MALVDFLLGNVFRSFQSVTQHIPVVAPGGYSSHPERFRPRVFQGSDKSGLNRPRGCWPTWVAWSWKRGQR